MSPRAKRFWRVPIIGVHEQLAALTLRWPAFKSQVVSGRLVSLGQVQPRPITEVYTVRIEYRVGGYPRTYIVTPPLQRRRPGQRIAHTYSDTELCLFTAAAHDWTPDQLIADTIVPWTYEWIVFYEAWLTTGSWRGGGTLPSELEEGGGRVRDAG